MAWKCDQTDRMSYNTHSINKSVLCPETGEASLEAIQPGLSLGFEFNRSHGTWLSRASTIVITVVET